jgi:1-acyl-sn-glycerol-3-phosphate acyltransferase
MGRTMNKRTVWTRRILRLGGGLLIRGLTRTTITGHENLRVAGPALYTANHASTFDALLFLILLPPDVVFVGPGDFKLLWPANWIIKFAGLILMKRGAVDREGLKLMLDVLKSGGKLAMFPEGGTWEKPIDDVKSGASYLSQATGAQIVPIGLGGTYQVWAPIVRLRRPRITVNIGPALPPVTVSEDRKRRQDELQAAAVDLMHRIYTLLPADTQQRYDRLARQSFSGVLSISRGTASPPEISFDALAELISKPNLFSPLYRNAKLPVKPFIKHSQWVPAAEMARAAQALLTAFSAGDYAGYLEYRLGDDKAAQIRAALQAVVTTAEQSTGAQMRFTPKLTVRFG